MMTKNTVISAIIPVYNAAKFLGECIESILNQTYSDFELILVDDGSADHSGSICDDYQEKDDRIIVVHKENGGVSSARNKGLDIASGRYISFIDADDKADKNLFKRLVTAIGEKDADLAICGYNIVGKTEGGAHYTRCMHSTDFSGSLKDFFVDIPFYLDKVLIQGPCNKLFKAEIIKRSGLLFSPELSFGEDTDFVYAYLAYVRNVVSVNECLYFYNRTEDGTLCSTFRQDKLDVWIGNYAKLHRLIQNVDGDLAERYALDFERSKCLVFHDCMRELYTCSPRFNKQSRIRLIESMLSNQEIRAAFEACVDMDRQTGLVYRLIEKKRVNAIDLYYCLKELLRKHFAGLFKQLRKTTKVS
jgi:glycosyltransferase involved in cell wall biosynthesis